MTATPSACSAALAIDVRPLQDTVIETNYSYYHLIDTGYPGWFSYSEKITLPPAPDPTNVGYGQNYAGVDLLTRMASVRLKHDFNSDWHLVVGGLNQDASRNINTPVNNLTNNNGNYTSSLANGFAPRFIMTSDAAYLDGNFTTGANCARPDDWHGRLQVAILFGDHAGDAGKRLVGHGEHQQPADLPISRRGPAECGIELRLLERVSAGRQCRRHHPLHRRLVGASGGEPGLVHADNYNAKAR